MSMVWILVLIPVVILSVIGVMLRLGRKEHQSAASELALIRALSETEAEQLAMMLIKRPGLFKVQNASVPFGNPDVPTHVRELLSRFDEIASGEFWIGVSALAQTARVAGFLKIGEDSELTELLVKPGDSRIYVSYDEGLPASSTLETEPSIWHEIVIASGVSGVRA
jgi:hypothetical protein